MPEDKGRVYDVDFNRYGWCQVLIECVPVAFNGKTSDERLQALLLTGLATGSAATGFRYEDTSQGRIVSAVRLVGETNPGKVSSIEVGFESPICRVEIDRRKLIALDPRIVMIVAQSLESPEATFEYSVDGDIIFRAKLNRG